MERFSRDGLTFDVSDHGPADGRLVVALHGFPEDRHCWTGIAGRLAETGHRVLAPDQRGYSPGARPSGRRNYVVTELVADVLAMADAAGAERFDVIGHDWGAVVSWALAARHPDRVRSLTALSVPHTRAFVESTWHGPQLLRSWYMLAFQVPVLPEATMRRIGTDRAVQGLTAAGCSPADARRFAARFAEPGAMTGPINWYRALPFAVSDPLPDVAVATLYVWGDRDRFVTRWAAEHCGRFVSGPYRFEPLPGFSHFLPTEAPDVVTALFLDHLASTEA